MERPLLPLGDYVQLLAAHDLLVQPTAADLARRVAAVTCDSRGAVPGSLFLCKGAAFKEEYLREALRRGAFAYVSERPHPVAVPCVQVKEIRLTMGLLADLAWGHPSGRMPVVGITGTKGKTTTAYFLKAILDAWREGQHPVGLLSSIDTDDGHRREPSVLTTPEPLDLQRHLWNALDAGCGWVVMECSSQALKYGRLTGVDLETALFLNLGEDHISPKEHPTAEDYFQSKLKIFSLAKNAVVNLDSDRADEVLSAAGVCKRVLTYSRKNPAADLYLLRSGREGAGLGFTVMYGGKEENFTIPMAGEFNLDNALAALCAASLAGVPAQAVRKGLAAARVPGRMETWYRDGKTVIVDYAHNGMSLAAVLRAVRKDYPEEPVTVLFGCTGGKGLDRREGMGKAAGELADTIFLTEDDAASEDVETICAEIGSYIAPYGKTWTVIPDRAEAIRQAIETAQRPSVIVLAGKGCETRQLRKNGPEPWATDALLAKKWLGLPLF